MTIRDGYCLILAQDDAQPFMLPGSPAGEGTQQVDGAPGAGNGGASADPFPPGFFLIVLLVLGGMIVFSMIAQRRDRRKREAMLNLLKKHDKVQTIGGVIGSVVDVKKDLVVLKVDESSNTRITVARSAIQQILNATPESPVAPAETPEE
ncbi:MAG: preprotein translocase subunit YajC [Planctomycetota bacterium]|jgi:preprotein translocase subunit YajC